MMTALARAAELCIDDSDVQNLANLAWAFAKVRQPAELLFAMVARAAERYIPVFTQQNLANIAWSFATASCSFAILLQRLAMAGAEQRTWDFKEQSLANVL
eukprot:gnl/MRDRNA2_/MRDRNA2_63085_c0_seq1.p1 gnl/MRDRNA2_/MRDRNA2_63085_c0~~gnl/MRDRNA2_/MRDRNA2_63085_c0_seq1.p1  ORF type:complete len:101 (+),score=22.19 gnl/MRDRNA2_/MRDRNA2_63085_c0_seq1:155-457(+)